MTELHTPLPAHDVGPPRLPSLRGALGGRKDGQPEEEGRPTLVRQGSMDFLSPLVGGGCKATGKVIGLSAKLQQHTTRAPALASSSSSSNLFALGHDQPAYKPSHSTSFQAFQGDFIMSPPSPVESPGLGLAAGEPSTSASGAGRRLELGAEIPSRAPRKVSVPAPIPPMGPSALRTSTTSTSSPNSPIRTITTTAAVQSSLSTTMGPPSSTAPLPARRLSLRPSTMMKRSTSSQGNVNPLLRAAVVPSPKTTNAQLPPPPPQSRRQSLPSPAPPSAPATRLIKPLKPRLARSHSHASSLHLHLASPAPQNGLAATPAPLASSQSAYALSSSTCSQGSVSPMTTVVELSPERPVAGSGPEAEEPAGPVLPSGGAERKRVKLAVQVPSAKSWETLGAGLALGSPFLEHSTGAGGGGMFGESDVSMEVDEDEKEREPTITSKKPTFMLGDAFGM